ncbi:MAG: hypothetical protein ACFFDG_05350 [Promethearchaeota archaeon]
MTWEIQEKEFLMKFIGCTSSELNYLLYLINKTESEFHEDIIASIKSMFSNIDYPFESDLIDEIFSTLGTLIFINVMGKYTKKGDTIHMKSPRIDGDMMKDKRYKFSLSVFRSKPFNIKIRKKIVNDFNLFLERY